MVKVVFLGSCRFSPYEILAVPDPIPGAHNTDEGYDIAFKIFKPAIDDAEVVIVHNPDGIGEHTGRDLDYAKSQNKHIVYTHDSTLKAVKDWYEQNKKDPVPYERTPTKWHRLGFILRGLTSKAKTDD